MSRGPAISASSLISEHPEIRSGLERRVTPRYDRSFRQGRDPAWVVTGSEDVREPLPLSDPLHLHFLIEEKGLPVTQFPGCR